MPRSSPLVHSGCRLCLRGFICIPGVASCFALGLRGKECGLSHEATGFAFCGYAVALNCPSNGFRFNAVCGLSDAFSFRKRCSVCPRERKWLINDSCAFSDERPRGKALLVELHLHPGCGFRLHLHHHAGICFALVVSFHFKDIGV